MTDFRQAPRRTNASPIAEARLEKGWTQQQLAAAIGITQPTLAQWETGRRSPKMETLKRIGDALGVPWIDLIEE